jgi:porin
MMNRGSEREATAMRRRDRALRASALVVLPLAALLAAAPARAQDADAAQPAFTLEGEYILDIVAVAQGEEEGVRHVDLLTVTGDLDLGAVAGWNGARLVAQAIAGTGGEPNLLAGTLQGIDNAEVPRNRVKLYQFYLSQELAALPVTLRAGFIDLNAEFYANDAAGLLIAPAFGIGSELAATGPNGPAIFPSTALTALVRAEPTATTYAAFALVNAESGVLGDRGGIAGLYEEGGLLIGEVGLTRFGKVALGAWTYTKRQDDIRLRDPAGDPLRQRAHGGYVLLEVPLGSAPATPEGAAPPASVFVRAGLSDGDTTPYSGGWQAGILVNRLFAGRPDSQLSLGANQAFLTGKFRRNEADAGIARGPDETGFEITLADRVAPWLTLQGDVQYVRNSDRRPGARDALIVGLRFIFAAASAW